MKSNKQPPCSTCGGTGQISFFKGESRFLLTDEECPACLGLGFLLDKDDQGSQEQKTQDDE